MDDSREGRQRAREADETLQNVLRSRLEANRSRYRLTDEGRIERVAEPRESTDTEERQS
jgi:hypothetical protein